MINIFYDFETSSRDLLGQILSYSFIVTDNNYDIKNELSGTIKLNRTQLPEVGAILTNKLPISELQKNGDPEYIAAHKIYQFINQYVEEKKHVNLIGFNSNTFDLQFLRNLLIRYGINPYFFGKTKNIDILHFLQYIAFKHPNDFKWALTTSESADQKITKYYSFKLEDTTKSFGLLNTAQSHQAREDVLLTINLVSKLEKEFNEKLLAFKATNLTIINPLQPLSSLFKQKVRDYSETDQLPEKFIYKFWLPLSVNPKELLILDIEKYNEIQTNYNWQDCNFSDQNPTPHQEDIISCIRYINPNKQFFLLDPLDPEKDNTEKWDQAISSIKENTVLSSLNRTLYFDLTKKNWDIEYQIHELGFERIPLLKTVVEDLLANPNSYNKTVQELLEKKDTLKDNYLIQLYNRVYLNYHPKALPQHLHRYLIPRYITGTLVRNQTEFTSLSNSLKNMSDLIKSQNTIEDDKKLLIDLDDYYSRFIKENQLSEID